MFVVFEGLDRAGKTTQVSLLEAHLAAAGTRFRSFKYPERTGTHSGPLVNQLLKGQVQLHWNASNNLFMANMFEIEQLIAPHLPHRATEWLIFDRYSYSNIVYSAARGLEPRLASKLVAPMPQPDHVIFLNVGQATAASRADFGGEIFETEAFQAKVRRGFEELPKPPGWHHLDVDGLDAAAVHTLILQTLSLA